MSPRNLDDVPGWENVIAEHHSFSGKDPSYYASYDNDFYGNVCWGDKNSFSQCSKPERLSYEHYFPDVQRGERYESATSSVTYEHYQPQCTNFRWWIPAEGLREDVVRAMLQPYLGPEAQMIAGNSSDGEPGYRIAAYRTFTPAMIQDMKDDSVEFEQITYANAACQDEACDDEALSDAASDESRTLMNDSRQPSLEPVDEENEANQEEDER